MSVNMFNAIEFLKDHNIEHWTKGKNVTSGWVNIQCPMCYDSSNHGGFNLTGKSYYNCWNCGHHFLDTIISNLLECDIKKAKQILKKYSDESEIEIIDNKKRIIDEKEKLELPYGSKELSDEHIKYLLNRNFDHDKIIDKWNIKGTTHLGDYKFRIIIPIYFNNKLVSYQGRDITGKQDARYKACKIKDELLHHKFILYGIDKIKNRKAVVVEGCTDVWRLGYGAVATFGTGWTNQQLNLLNKRADSIFILYDNEEEAKEKAEKLCWQLSSLGKEVEMILMFDGDPATLTDHDAKYIMEDLIGEYSY